LIDPTIVEIGPGAGSTQGSIRTQGTDIEIIASERITIQDDGYVNTRHTAAGIAGGDERAQASTGNSGDITLAAPGIDILGAVIAHATGDFTGGVVTLDAVQPES